MRSRVSVLCDQIIEAGWLLALIVVPLFFNVYSSRVFEPDKIAILRSIVLFMALAWLVKTLGEGAREPMTASRNAGGADGAQGGLKVWRARILGVPLLLPTLLLVLAYIISTVFSVTPRVSLWGSYQRLQGTYTMLSYIVVFLLLLQTLRRREQLERIWVTVILTSLPIAFYGMLQHYGLDPLPWGGNVVARVASNLGNAIFVSAYMIMVAPMTLGRIIHVFGLALDGASTRAKVAFAALYGASLLLQLWVWGAGGVGRGLVASALLTLALVLAALYLRRPIGRFIVLGCLGLILVLQLVCILFSQSRGPLLGLGGALFFFALLYVFARRWRLTAIILSCIAGLAIGFLVLINLPQSPLAAIREAPYIGRLGRVFEVESGTGKVRVLIWQGAIEMLKDRPLRALVGYGPESMYVAYNPYYPPDLAHYEARNASPDRSHNETFDALLMTGVLGLLAYMFLFGSLFYHGLSWLGLIVGPRQGRVFALLGALGALLGIGLVYLLDRSLRFAGVGLPIGFVASIALYANIRALATLKRRPDAEPAHGGSEGGPRGGADVVLLVALFSSVVAHFVEIHFGIAVAATRTYFWAYAALLVVIGQRLVSLAEPVTAPTTALGSRRAANGVRAQSRGEMAQPGKRRPRDHGGRSTVQAKPAGLSRAPAVKQAGNSQLLVMALLTSMILITLFWDYTTNPLGQKNALAILRTSLTTMASKQAPQQVSLGVLALFAVTGLTALGVVAPEHLVSPAQGQTGRKSLAAVGQFLIIVVATSGLYALIHAASLSLVNLPNLVYGYYVALGIVGLAVAAILYRAAPHSAAPAQGWRVALYLAGAVVVLVVANAANISTVRADVLYKQGLRYDQQGAWEVAASLYGEAIKMAPNQDFYYLFQGRALMEQAKQENDAPSRERLLGVAEDSLLNAQQLNPLNTDHTANLGRLYRTWAEMSEDAAARRSKLDLSLQEYEHAVKLSPNNAQLWNEWASVYMALGNETEALAKLQRSLELDQRFSQTFLLLGDLHMSRAAWTEAISAYQQLIDVDPASIPAWSSMGYAYSQLGQLEEAIEANSKILEYQPDDYNTLKNLALLYGEVNRIEDAVRYAQLALARAPEAEKAGLRQYIDEQQALLSGAKP